MERYEIKFPNPEEPFSLKGLDELPEPYKSRYGEKLKEINGAAIIDDTAYTDNGQRAYQICEVPVYLCMKMREEYGRGIDPQPKAMHGPRYTADLIIIGDKIYKNRFE